MGIERGSPGAANTLVRVDENDRWREIAAAYPDAPVLLNRAQPLQLASLNPERNARACASRRLSVNSCAAASKYMSVLRQTRTSTREMGASCTMSLRPKMTERRSSLWKA